jgi:hypothetical protein
MVTLERSDYIDTADEEGEVEIPEVFYRDLETKPRRARSTYEYQIGRGENALLVLLFGLGFLVFVIGLCTGLLTVAHGFLGWMAAWVLGFALRSYWGTWVYRVRTGYEPRR